MIGISPREVDLMSLWQFVQMQRGWLKANSSGEDDKPKSPSEEEFFAALERFGD